MIDRIKVKVMAPDDDDVDGVRNDMEAQSCVDGKSPSWPSPRHIRGCSVVQS